MSAQISDRYIINGEYYCFVEKSEPMGFHPMDYGIIPQFVHSSCWNGYWCEYIINDIGICLDGLYINAVDDIYPDINGVSVLRYNEGKTLFKYMGFCVYKKIGLKLPYNGKILVGRDFQIEYYTHMGYQRPWGYKTLKEIVFEQGRPIQINDSSETAAKLREIIKERDLMSDCTLSYVPKGSFENCGIDVWWMDRY